jgi:hypothetical protein
VVASAGGQQRILNYCKIQRLAVVDFGGHDRFQQLKNSLGFKKIKETILLKLKKVL